MEIFKSYVVPILQLILTWPVVFLIIILIFRKRISQFIDEIGEVDWGDRKVTRKDKQETVSAINAKSVPKSKWNYKKLFLDLFLRPSTLEALLWFHNNQGEHDPTSFMQKFLLTGPTLRSDSDEKAFILKALTENDLLDIKENKYSISKEGTEYLKYRKLID